VKYLSKYKVFESKSEPTLLKSDFVQDIQDILMDVVDSGQFKISRQIWSNTWEDVSKFNLTSEYSHEAILFQFEMINPRSKIEKDNLKMLVDCIKRCIDYIDRFEDIGYTVYCKYNGISKKHELDELDNITETTYIHFAIFTED
jgi:hypothetical protein